MKKERNRKKDYFRLILAIIFLVLIVFIFDLDRTSSFISIGTIAVFIIFLHETFGVDSKKD